MHTLQKIKVFRVLLWFTYLPALLFIYPLVLFKPKKKARIFFLLDRYELGGAQRVHLDILDSIAEVDKQVYFTRFSRNSLLKNEFYTLPNTYCKDIHFWCDNLLLRIFTVHYIAFYINKHKNVQVFSSNSTFFYDMLPFLSKDVKKIELLHNFTYGKKGMEFFGLGNYKNLDLRLCVDYYTFENIKEQYTQYNVPESYTERIHVIEPGVPIPDQNNKTITLPLVLLYAGRGGAQKRIHLLDRIARYCIDNQLPVIFHFAGSIENELSDLVKQKSILHGQVDKNKMMELYELAHIIIMTSAFEGFPMLIKEGMAHGCIPLVTALEGNKTHLTDRKNALLIEEITNEDILIQQCIGKLNFMLSHLEDTNQLSANAYHYAKMHFNRADFLTAYRKLLLSQDTNSIKSTLCNNH